LAYCYRAGWEEWCRGTATSMSCLRANATTKGSKAIGGVPGGAVSIKVNSWVVLGVTCLAAGLLL
jgi:hypothetical protein